MRELLLYVTRDCGLCDEAVDILAQARAPDFTCVCIDDVPPLVERYATRVPVLHDTDRDLELGWPFDPLAVRQFLAGSKSAS